MFVGVFFSKMLSSFSVASKMPLFVTFEFVEAAQQGFWGIILIFRVVLLVQSGILNTTATFLLRVLRNLVHSFVLNILFIFNGK